MPHPTDTPRSPRSGSSRRHRDAVATARMTPDELARVRAAAHQNGQTVSEFVRELVLRETATA